MEYKKENNTIYINGVSVDTLEEGKVYLITVTPDCDYEAMKTIMENLTAHMKENNKNINFIMVRSNDATITEYKADGIQKA